MSSAFAVVAVVKGFLFLCPANVAQLLYAALMNLAPRVITQCAAV